VHYIFSDDADPTIDLPPPKAGERVITVDIDFAPTAYVKAAHSLSPDFAVTAARVQVAPSMMGAVEEGGLMLAIEGVETGLRGVKASAGVQELARVFAERMEGLRKVVEWSGLKEGQAQGVVSADAEEGMALGGF
jgi:hypothetical protein